MFATIVSDRRGGRVVGVTTSEGEVFADTVVNTAGLGAVASDGRHRSSRPGGYSRGQMFVTERIPPLLRTYVHNIKQTPSGTIVHRGNARERDHGYGHDG